MSKTKCINCGKSVDKFSSSKFKFLFQTCDEVCTQEFCKKAKEHYDKIGMLQELAK